MTKKYNLYKIFIIFIMTTFSLHIFILDLKIPKLYTSINNKVYLFFQELFISTNTFDIIWIILFIFIYYLFYKNYYINNKYHKIKIISSIISIIISITIIIIQSINTYHNLSMITNSYSQLFKCIIVSLGYYFIIYIAIREILVRIVDKNEEKR